MVTDRSKSVAFSTLLGSAATQKALILDSGFEEQTSWRSGSYDFDRVVGLGL